MDLVKSNSQVVPIQGGFLTLLITSSFSGVYVMCVCACLRACMCGEFVCVCVCVSHPPLSKVCSRLLCAPTPLFLLPFTFPALLSPSPELLLCLSSLSSRVCVLCVILSCLNLTPPRIYPLTPLMFPDMSRTHLYLCVCVLSPLPLCSAQPCLLMWRYSSIQTPCPAPLAAVSPACPQLLSAWIEGLEVPPDLLPAASCVLYVSVCMIICVCMRLSL